MNLRPAAPLAAALALLATVPAAAQMVTSTAGDVGSASLRGAYPGAGGAVALPMPLASTPTTARGAAAAGAAPTTSGTTNAANLRGGAGGAAGAGSSGGSGGRGGGRRGNAGAGGTGSASAGSSAGRGGSWVLCPPGGASGLAPLFAGTDLSCAPD